MPAVPADPKPEAKHKLIGRPTNRIDARDLVTGKAKFALDLDVPGAMPTVVARPPTIGGTVATVYDSVARSLPGVLAVARIPTGVAVVAETFGQAIEARDALKITWGATPPFGPLAGAVLRAAGGQRADRLPDRYRKLGRDPVWFRRASLKTARARAVLGTRG